MRGQEAGAVAWILLVGLFYPVFVPLLITALGAALARQFFGLEIKLLLLVTVNAAFWVPQIATSAIKLKWLGLSEPLSLLVAGSTTLVLCVLYWVLDRKRKASS